MSDTGYARSFAYDRYGNMWVPSTSGVPQPANMLGNNVFTAGNQIAGTPYDGAGNQLNVYGNTAAYDAENRQTSVTEPAALGGGTETNGYDGSGQRIQKVGPSGVVSYVYDAFGNLAAEYTTAAQSGPSCSTCYLTYDQLGTVKLVTDQNANVIARHDYLPFGEEIPAGSAGRGSQWGATNDNIATKFTGQIRDSETGADFFHARYFMSAQGRFASPDPQNAGADITNPQSWNAYAYVLNNPLVNVDPSGLDCVTFDNGTIGDDGQGTTCPGSQTSQTDNVNGSAPAPIENSNITTFFQSPYSGNADFP